MHHSAAVDAQAGAMYLYGGVTHARRTGERRPADARAGLLHRYTFARGAWEQLQTEGDGPVSTTLLALAFYAGALWAVPQVRPPSSSSSSSSSTSAYRLHRFDPASRRWARVRTQGEPPCPRAEAATAFLEDGGCLVVTGGVALGGARRVLGDAFCLDLAAAPPRWSRLRPALRGCAGGAAAAAATAAATADAGGDAAAETALAAAGHAGAAFGGAAVFVGGCRRLDVREPEAAVRVREPTARFFGRTNHHCLLTPQAHK